MQTRWLLLLTLDLADKEIVAHPEHNQSDSFYFVEGKLIMHNKAQYTYVAVSHFCLSLPVCSASLIRHPVCTCMRVVAFQPGEGENKQSIPASAVVGGTQLQSRSLGSGGSAAAAAAAAGPAPASTGGSSGGSGGSKTTAGSGSGSAAPKS